MSSLSPRPRTADDYGASNDQDDPLAELARIVAETSNFEPARPALRRVEPQIDFEAELFNELRASIDVADDRAAPSVAAPRAAVAPAAYQPQRNAAAYDDDAAFERALHPAGGYDAAAYAPTVDARYADDGYADPRYADPNQAYADPNQGYAEAGYDPSAYADPYQADPYAPEAYADDPRYAEPVYDAHDRNAVYQDAPRTDPRAEISLDEFERDLAATTRQSVGENRTSERRAEPSFDAYDDFDDYDTLPPVENELTADRSDSRVPTGGTAALADAPADGRLGMKIAAAAMGLVVIGGLGFLGYRAFGPNPVANNGGAPPVIRADAEPAKVVPQGATPAKTESDRVAPANQQRIVARQEDPVDTVGNRQVRVVGPGAQPAEGEDDAPRRVRTVVVRPDGTIVQPNAGAAPALPPTPTPAAPAAAAAPAATTALPPAPSQPVEPTVAAVPAPAVPAPGVPQPQPAPSRPAVQAEAPAAPAPEAPVARPTPPPPAAVAATRPVPPAPQQRQTAAPASAPLPLVPPAAPAAPTTVAAVPAAPAAPAAPASGGGSFVVQLSSQRSEADARRDFQRFQSRFSGLLAGKSADIQTADLGNRGVYYRLRVGPGGSREDAVRLCEQIKAQGGDCVVARR